MSKLNDTKKQTIGNQKTVKKLLESSQKIKKPVPKKSTAVTTKLSVSKIPVKKLEHVANKKVAKKTTSKTTKHIAEIIKSLPSQRVWPD